MKQVREVIILPNIQIYMYTTVTETSAKGIMVRYILTLMRKICARYIYISRKALGCARQIMENPRAYLTSFHSSSTYKLYMYLNI